MKNEIVVIIALLGLPAMLVFGQHAPMPQRKEMREAEQYFNKPLSFVSVPCPEDSGRLSVLFHTGDQLFRIEAVDGGEGYLLSTRAMGRFDFFDYGVFYDDELVVRGVLVTRYRSDHGAAICQRKWLQQFNGYEGGPLTLGKDIDGVSGGTISASSMLTDMQRCHLLVKTWLLH